MTTLYTLITHKNFFMMVITALFACSAVRNVWACDWNQAVYALGAVILNCAVLSMKG
jgi:hypothetical protein